MSELNVTAEATEFHPEIVFLDDAPVIRPRSLEWKITTGIAIAMMCGIGAFLIFAVKMARDAAAMSIDT